MKADQENAGRFRDWTRAGLGLLGVLLTAGAGFAQSAPAAGSVGKAPAKSLEEVSAVVGDTPILRSEVEEQVQAVAEQMQVAAGDTAALRKLHHDVLARMVDDQILLLEAKSENLKVEDEEINKAVDQQIQSVMRTAGSVQAFQDQLKKEGLSEQELRTRYREEARKQILTNKLIQKEVRPKVAISDSTVRRFFEENRSQLPKKPRALHIQDLFVRTRPDSVVEKRTRERALDLRKKILAGMAFSDAAVQYSDDPRGKEGGALGRLSHGDLDPDLEAAAFALPEGEVSTPVRSKFGYHLLLVTAKDPGGDWIEVSHVLFAITPGHADEMDARDRAAKLKEQIESGSLDFGDAIHKYSDDTNSRGHDGDMGWIPIDNFYGDMKGVVDTIRVGRLAGPVSGDGGYHIFKMLGEQAEGNYSFDEIQDQMKQLALQQAMQKELQGYVDKLRPKYFVEIRSNW